MYVGTWLIFGIILAPVYVMLLGWFLGKPRNIRKSLLGLSYMVGLTVLLWGGMFAISMVFKYVFFR